jgi:hypothetical protein
MTTRGLPGVGRQVWRAFLRGWRKVFRPYHCKECGRPLRRLRLRDLTPGQVVLHRKGGTLRDLLDYGYHCPRRCEGPGRVVMIM